MPDLIQTPQFIMTSAILLAAFGLSGFLIWTEKRPRQKLMPSLLPTTPILLLCTIIIMLAAVHLVHIIAPGATAVPQ